MELETWCSQSAMSSRHLFPSEQITDNTYSSSEERKEIIDAVQLYSRMIMIKKPSMLSNGVEKPTMSTERERGFYHVN